ncbi:unnamed protein product [Gongylonema pulchrum]|uniref:Sen15 domain-containing protein n=1 Tax=Gongylonema pulchrum TaxID=637853 RepID=A0A183EJX6_9BILA|nr:unnamed protein product [Gongylonema pulchrum]
MPRQIVFDGPHLKLNAFLALFTLPATNAQRVFLDLLNDGIVQYQSPCSETNEVFFFASSYSVKLRAYDGVQKYVILVPSMQKTVLSWIDEHFEEAMGQRLKLACAYLHAVGLVKPFADYNPGVPSDSPKVIFLHFRIPFFRSCLLYQCEILVGQSCRS